MSSLARAFLPLVAVCAGPGACLLAEPASAAAPSPANVALEWRRGPGASECIGAPELRAMLERRLGRELQPQDTKALRVSGQVRRVAAGWRASVRPIQPDGRASQPRSVAVRGDNCRELDEALLLVLSVALDAWLRSQPARPPPRPNRPPEDAHPDAAPSPTELVSPSPAAAGTSGGPRASAASPEAEESGASPTGASAPAAPDAYRPTPPSPQGDRRLATPRHAAERRAVTSAPAAAPATKTPLATQHENAARNAREPGTDVGPAGGSAPAWRLPSPTFAAGTALTWGLMPAAAWGLRGGLAWRGARGALRLGIAHFPLGERPTNLGSIDFTATTFEPDACATLADLSAWTRLELCAGLHVGALTARAERFASRRVRGRSALLGAQAAFGATWQLGQRAAIGGGLGGMWPWIRDEFAVTTSDGASTRLHAIAPVVPRCELWASWQL